MLSLKTPWKIDGLYDINVTCLLTLERNLFFCEIWSVHKFSLAGFAQQILMEMFTPAVKNSGKH